MMQAMAAISLLVGQTRVVYEWMRWGQLELWWHWLALLAGCVAVVLYVLLWYRRDAGEQPRPVRWTLMLLRVVAFSGLLLFFFQLEKRTEQRIVRESRVAILVDTSLSMTLPADAAPVSAEGTRRRIDQAVELVGASPLLQKLSRQHRVDVYRFDAAPQPVLIASLPRQAEEQPVDGPVGEATAEEPSVGRRGEQELVDLAWGRWWMRWAMVLGLLGFLVLGASLAGQVTAGQASASWSGWGLLGGVTIALGALALAGWAAVPNSRYSWDALLGRETDRPWVEEGHDPEEQPVEESAQDAVIGVPADWMAELEPRGTATRLGDAVKAILDQELGNPLAGIVAITDGRSNAGLAPQATLLAAQNARVPLYAIGLGSPVSPPNVQLVELDIPRRVYPGDQFEATALLGGSGFAGEAVTVQILAGPEGASTEQMEIEDEITVVLKDEGEATVAHWTLTPRSVGRWHYAARVLPPPTDFDAKDNVRYAEVEVIERRNRVLIVAGGPTREYQFVRNLLFRDRDVESHVLLQTAGPLTSQEAQKLLDVFPADRQELSQYDAILAFDADWTKIPEQSVVALEQWVAEQAGGFLLVAGSVEMPKWLARSADGVRSQTLRALAPVVLEKRGSALLASGRIEADTPWPLQVTPEGQQTDMLWLTDDPQTSMEVWRDFEGVYSYHSAYELKPGGKSLLLFSDPRSAIDGQLPIYLAIQFYGAGRTAYLGGGELWRLRRLGDHYFDRLYTKLVRWLSQGRLLLDSDRGVLLVDRDQGVLGEQVMVRAVLKNERYEPLIQSEVVARLIDPAGVNQPLVLRPLPDGSQPGVYTGQFTIARPGEYSVQLNLGGLASEELLRATVRGRVPTRELQNAERNDALLAQLAAESGGKYWRGPMQALAIGDGEQWDIITAIEPRDQVAFVPGSPDRVFQLRWRTWLLALIAGCLTLEWLSRRLYRLA
ncbi:MAG: hypothetical protein KatS3mg111_1346 [Pirellulaceae bacterium]|nr:MAG: hypothetical protein KatS3mg111_1346 [Pirellulaceae bacterium]